MEKVKLSEMIPTEILQSVQDAFSRYSGLAAIIADENGVPVTKQSGFSDFCKMTRESSCGSINCQKCGRDGAHRTLESGKPSVYRCHTGMVDFAAPILLNGEYMGHFSGGQTRVESMDEDFLRKKAEEYEIDPEEYIAAAKRSCLTDYASVERAAEFLAEIAKAFSQIAFERVKIHKQKERIDQAAKTQLDFMRNYAADAGVDMQAVITFLQKIGDGELDLQGEDTKKFAAEKAGVMQQQITSVNESVNRAEIGRGELKLREGRYDIRLVLDRKVSEMKPACIAAGKKLSWSIKDDVPDQLVGDASRIADIAGLWIEMAKVYPEVTWIEVCASVRKRSYGVELVIRVRDDGPGPDPVAKELILEHIRSRKGVELWDNDYREKGVTEIGHLLHAMSGRVEMDKDEDGWFGISFAFPQLQG